METKIAIATTSSKNPSSSKRLFFDRRYGWVYDEWKDPSEEALAGGRGVFCILPLGKTLLSSATQSINVVTNSAIKVLENPDLISLPALQDQLHKFMSSVQKIDMKLFSIKGNQTSVSTPSSSQQTSISVSSKSRIAKST